MSRGTCARLLCSLLACSLVAYSAAQPLPEACDAVGPRVACGELRPGAPGKPPACVARPLAGPALPRSCSAGFAIGALPVGCLHVVHTIPHSKLRLHLPQALGILVLATTGTTATGEASCAEMGCCWAADPLVYEAWQPDVYQPSCYYPNTGASSYNLQGGPYTLDTGPGGLRRCRFGLGHV